MNRLRWIYWHAETLAEIMLQIGFRSSDEFPIQYQSWSFEMVFNLCSCELRSCLEAYQVFVSGITKVSNADIRRVLDVFSRVYEPSIKLQTSPIWWVSRGPLLVLSFFKAILLFFKQVRLLPHLPYICSQKVKTEIEMIGWYSPRVHKNLWFSPNTYPINQWVQCTLLLSWVLKVLHISPVVRILEVNEWLFFQGGQLGRAGASQGFVSRFGGQSVTPCSRRDNSVNSGSGYVAMPCFHWFFSHTF